MAINTIDNYFAATKQFVTYSKLAVVTTLANTTFSMFDIAGQPGAGTLAIGNTANGVVPVDTDAGYPLINAFGGGAAGCIGATKIGGTAVGRFNVYDRVFAAGAYSFNSNVTLASQPDFSGRIPNADYTGCELWFECVTAFTGNFTLTVTYTDESGNAGATTGAVAFGSLPTLRRVP